MRKLVVISFIFISISNLTSQNQCFVVIDSLNKEPIPYCNIRINAEQSFVTNHLGEFCITSNKEDFDTIFISNIAYQQKSYVIHQNIPNSIIYLYPKQYELNELNVNWSKYKFNWRGNLFNRPDKYKNLWRYCQTGLHIGGGKDVGFLIETVSVLVKNPNETKVPFRLHIFDTDSTGEIGDELLRGNVYGCLKDELVTSVELDILKYQIKMPELGVFVTVELLSNQKPIESQIGTGKYAEKYNNRIAFTKARYRHRRLLKVSSWKPNSFYVESYPFTNVPGLVGDLPMIKVKLREIKK